MFYAIQDTILRYHIDKYKYSGGDLCETPY